MSICSVAGCSRKYNGKGYCSMHYARKRRSGDILCTKISPKGSGWIHQGYRHFQINNRRISEHRLIMEQIIGHSLLSSESVHHKNGNRLDNRPENLELWVKSQPCGQRAQDLLEWAKEIIDRYGQK